MKSFPGFLCFLLLSFLASLSIAPAQDEDAPAPESDVLAPKAYTFRMTLPPGTDLTARIKSKNGENQISPQEDGEVVQPRIEAVRRAVRAGMVRVSEKPTEGGKEIVRYYVGRWCAFDDVRRGLNVRRTSVDGLFFPEGDYHFPELLWAEPGTRQPDPEVKDGEPKIHLYKDGEQTLEVDAKSGLPLRFIDGEVEWKYSYKEDASPIVIPEKIKAALLRTLPAKAKS